MDGHIIYLDRERRYGADRETAQARARSVVTATQYAALTDYRRRRRRAALLRAAWVALCAAVSVWAVAEVVS